MANPNTTYQGKPCIHGHSGLRWVCDRSCVECRQFKQQQRRKTDLTYKSKEFHGLTKHPLYDVWTVIIQRCTNPKNPGYPNYGGRGITICIRWRNSFSAFLEDIGERPEPGYSLDRIDNDRGYEPGNTRWANRTTQARNSRHARLTLRDARRIRFLRAQGYGSQAIAKLFNVGRHYIDAIIRHDVWKEE